MEHGGWERMLVCIWGLLEAWELSEKHSLRTFQLVIEGEIELSRRVNSRQRGRQAQQKGTEWTFEEGNKSMRRLCGTWHVTCISNLIDDTSLPLPACRITYGGAFVIVPCSESPFIAVFPLETAFRISGKLVTCLSWRWAAEAGAPIFSDLWSRDLLVHSQDPWGNL